MTGIITIRGAGAYEGDYSTLLVQLSAPLFEDVTVDWTSTRSGTANPHEDFQEDDGNLTIAAGGTSRELSHSDSFYDYDQESDEFIEVEFYNPVNARFDQATPWLHAISWILDNDGTAQDRAIGVTNPVFVEDDTGNRQAVFLVSLSRPLEQDITLNFATRDGTAAAGSDYVARSGQITFLAGQTQATVAVNLLGDFTLEELETFDLVVTPTGDFANVGFGHIGTATILDDDSGDSRPIVSIESQDATEGREAYFVIRLSSASSETVTVQYRRGLGTASDDDMENDGTTGTVTFDPGETVAYVGYDSYYDYDNELDESVTLTLTSPVNAVLAGGHASVTETAWILDDDGTSQNRAVFITPAAVREPGPGETRMVYFDVELSRPSSETLTFDYQTVGANINSAVAGQDYIGAFGTLTFRPGQTELRVGVAIRGDTSLEQLENMFLRLVGPFPDAVASGPSTAFALGEIFDGSILGSSSNDNRYGSSSADAIFGLDGNDSLYGGAGNDFINGGRGRDHLNGSSGGDTLIGFRGNDLLDGGTGADRLTGGQGRDRMRAGDDMSRDVFIFDDNHTGTRRHRDIIEDFDSGEDVINLQRVDANAARNGDQAFLQFAGERSFSFFLANSLWTVDAGDNLVLRGDFDGRPGADFEILLMGIDTIVRNDLVL